MAKTKNTPESKPVTVNLGQLSIHDLKQIGYDSFIRKEYLTRELENTVYLINMIDQELERRTQGVEEESKNVKP